MGSCCAPAAAAATTPLITNRKYSAQPVFTAIEAAAVPKEGAHRPESADAVGCPESRVPTATSVPVPNSALPQLLLQEPANNGRRLLKPIAAKHTPDDRPGPTAVDAQEQPSYVDSVHALGSPAVDANLDVTTRLGDGTSSSKPLGSHSSTDRLDWGSLHRTFSELSTAYELPVAAPYDSMTSDGADSLLTGHAYKCEADPLEVLSITSWSTAGDDELSTLHSTHHSTHPFGDTDYTNSSVQPGSGSASGAIMQQRAPPAEGESEIRISLSGRRQLLVATVTVTNIDPEDPFGKPNQDRLIVEQHLGGSEEQQLFAVFDGHGKHGHDCAQYVQERLVEQMSSCEHFCGNLSKAYEDSFDQINRRMHDDHSIGDMLSGTTAITVTLRQNTLFVANIGDSRAILAQAESNGSWKAIDLSDDHTPFRKDELERVQACGAHVATSDELHGYCSTLHPSQWTADDPPRCWVPCCSAPGTAFTRSVGDMYAESIGVIATPEVRVHPLDATDEGFLVCSDGVTEHLTSQQIVDMVALYPEDPLTAAREIAARSRTLWLQTDDYTDDITIIVVRLSTEGVQSPPAPLQASPSLSPTPVAMPYTSLTGDWYGSSLIQYVLLHPQQDSSLLTMPKRKRQSRRRDDSNAVLSLLASLSESGLFAPESMNAPGDTMSLKLSSPSEAHAFPEVPKDAADAQMLTAALSSTALCHQMSCEQVEGLALVMDMVKLPKGGIVFSIGEQGEWFYVLCSGRFGAFGESGEVIYFEYVRHPHGVAPSFGETALLYGKTRQATVKALDSDSSLWRLHKQAWLAQRKLLTSTEDCSIQLPTQASPRTAEEVIVLEEAVKGTPLLGRLDVSHRARLYDVMCKRTLQLNEVLYSTGDEAAAMYVVLDGQLAVSVRGVPVHCYTAGSCFGEQALISNHHKRCSTVTASTECVLWVLEHNSFRITVKLLMSFLGTGAGAAAGA